MKCKHVNQLMAAYLDNETTSYEREEIQAHLTACQHCREELEALTATRSDLRKTLNTATADLMPSQHAWARLSERLDVEEEPRVVPWGGFKAKKPDRILFGNLFSRYTTGKVGVAIALMIALVVSMVIVMQSDDSPSRIEIVSDIAQKDPQVRAALGGGKVAVFGVEIINGSGCVLAGGETGCLVEACVDMETRTVTSFKDLGCLIITH